jgi:hypothetical protein
MLLAAMIFATAMISFASVYQYIAIATGKARTRIVGQYLAKGLMEKCLAAKFYNVLELASVSTPALTTADPPVTPITYPPVTMKYRKDGTEIEHVFETTVQVDDATSTPEGAAIFTSMRGRLVRVRVTWEEKNRRGPTGDRPYSEYRTYIGENS